jgi:AcrR family transcriptional regulator
METREKIIKSAIYVLGKRPRASLEEVAIHADVTRVTVNRHFKNRDNLLIEAEGYCISALSGPVTSIYESNDKSIDKIKSLLRHFIPLYQECNFLMRFSDWDETVYAEDSIFSKQIETMNEIVKGAQSDGTLRLDFPSDWISLFINYVAMAVGDINEIGAIAPKDSIPLAIETFLYGCSGE